MRDSGWPASCNAPLLSVAANIAEVHGRGSTKAFPNQLWIANGSLTELEIHVSIAARPGYIDDLETKNVFNQMHGTGCMLTGLRKSLESRISSRIFLIPILGSLIPNLCFLYS